MEESTHRVPDFFAAADVPATFFTNRCTPLARTPSAPAYVVPRAILQHPGGGAEIPLRTVRTFVCSLLCAEGGWFDLLRRIVRKLR